MAQFGSRSTRGTRAAHRRPRRALDRPGIPVRRAAGSRSLRRPCRRRHHVQCCCAISFCFRRRRARLPDRSVQATRSQSLPKPPPITNRLTQLGEEGGGMSQAARADAIVVTRQTVIAIEQGRYSLSLEGAFGISRLCGVGVKDVSGWREDGRRRGAGRIGRRQKGTPRASYPRIAAWRRPDPEGITRRQPFSLRRPQGPSGAPF